MLGPLMTHVDVEHDDVGQGLRKGVGEISVIVDEQQIGHGGKNSPRQDPRDGA